MHMGRKGRGHEAFEILPGAFAGDQAVIGELPAYVVLGY